MKQCPGCGNVPSMDEDTVSNADATWHAACYEQAAAEAEAAEPDPIERIAVALEKLAEQKEREWNYLQTPWDRAEKR